MQPDEATKFDKIQRSLFEDSEVTKLTAKDLELRSRYQAVFVIWIENPNYTDREIVRYIIQQHKISRTQAYHDLQRIKTMLGNVRNAAKEWQRYAVIEMCKEAFNIAKKKGDVKSMVMAIDKLGKYTKLDKDEQEALPWDQLLPPNLEPTSDVSVLKITRSAEFQNQVKLLKKKYLGDNTEIQEADVVT
ncbi:MAG: hypothetical protein K0B15_06510 [Lentimicrobium sp.]|nr:hypothetical protein [Lentimicrobium sp.]